jgi:hypothetical protein
MFGKELRKTCSFGPIPAHFAGVIGMTGVVMIMCLCGLFLPISYI